MLSPSASAAAVNERCSATVKAQGPIAANSGEALMPALTGGLGIARLPAFILGDTMETGAVVEILPDWRPAPVGLHLLTPPSPLRPARVEALMAGYATITPMRPDLTCRRATDRLAAVLDEG